MSSVICEPFVPPEVHTSGVVVENVTVRPDGACADTVTGDWANVLFPSGPKLIVCLFGATLYVTVTVDELPTLSVDVTVNVLVPVDDVSIGLRIGDGSLAGGHT